MTILTTQAALQEATADDLRETLAALTGKPAPARFSSLAAGRARVANAMLAATDAAGHLGVKKDGATPTLTADDRVARGGQRTIEGLPLDDEATPPPPVVWPGTERRATPRTEEEPLPPPPASNPFPPGSNPFPPGSPEGQLWRQSDAPKPTPKPRGIRSPGYAFVRATFNGTSKPQPGSRRMKCLEIIQLATKDRDGGIMIGLLEKKMGEPPRGFVQKLFEKGHVVLLDKDGKEVAQ